MKEFSSSPGLHSAPLGPPTGGEKGEPRKRDPTKAKQRRHQSKDSSDGSRQQQDVSDSGVPDPAKKSRRKKSRESNGTGGSSRTRSKANADEDSSLKNSDLDSTSST